MQILIRTVTSTGADGSGVGFILDRTTTPTVIGDSSDIVSGAGQQLVDQGPFTILWIWQIAGSDLVKADIRF